MMNWSRRACRAPVLDMFAHLDAAPELVLHDPRVTIDGRVLIERLSLTADAGQLWYVANPNDAGKSTWLSVLADLRSRDGGSVTLDDVALADWPVLAMACCRTFLPWTLYDSLPITMYQAMVTGRHPHLVYRK